MPRPKGSFKTPKLTLHRASGLAVVRIDGKDEYCGDFGTAEAQRKYDRLIAEWILRGRQLAPELARGTGAGGGPKIEQILAAFWTHAETHYSGCVRADGKVTGELDNYRLAMKPLRRLYAMTPAADFGPLALKAVRKEMIRLGWCRNYINRHVSRIKHIFKWATENQLLPPSVYHGLMAVAGLQVGRSEAKETDAVKPVAEADMRAVLPFLSPQVKAMVELESLCGARPGELCIMRTCDIDRSRKVWVYRPERHKTQHHGHAREIRIGPAAQAIVTPFLKTNLAAYIFSPTDAEAARHEQQRENRKTPLTPSQQRRAERATRRQRKRPPLDYYTPTSYRRAVIRACEKAFQMPSALREPCSKAAKEADTAEAKKARQAARRAWREAHTWHPHQLRHLVGTNVRRAYGIDAVQVILGHKTRAMAERYAAPDLTIGDKIMSEVG